MYTHVTLRSASFAIIALAALIYFCTSCESESSQITQAPVDDKNPTSISLNTLSSMASNDLEVKAIYDLVHQFDALILKGKDRDISECYTFHAHEMRLDFFNNRPFDISFPYNGKFDLSMFDAPHLLNFLTKNCGLHNEKENKTVHYYCLKSESKYMDYLHNISLESQLISDFCKQYLEAKVITPDMRQQMLMRSGEELDFAKPEHRFFYMLFHIMVNEEKVAYTKYGS